MLALLVLAAAAQAHEPIIDVHRHSRMRDDDRISVRDQMLAEMDRDGVAVSVVALARRPDVAVFDDHADSRFVSAIALGCPLDKGATKRWCFDDEDGWPDPKWVETEVRDGRIEAIHELMGNYVGLPASAPQFAPYLAIAERHGIPVGIHTGFGPGPGEGPREDPNCCPDYRAEVGHPKYIRDVLQRHPRLKVWLQHFGAGSDHSPYALEDAVAILRDYPNVNLDMSIVYSFAPPEALEAGITRLIDSGFGDRIMFGSDEMPVAAIRERLAGLKSLTDAQRTAILHGNAERFFGLTAK